MKVVYLLTIIIIVLDVIERVLMYIYCLLQIRRSCINFKIEIKDFFEPIKYCIKGKVFCSMLA